MTPSGIEPATFQLVVQYLNHLRHRMPQTVLNSSVIFLIKPAVDIASSII